MSSLRNIRKALLISHSPNLINDEEFLMLYYLNTSKNPNFPYWNYQLFDLKNLSDEERKAEFRFYKNDIHFLKEALHFPDEVIFSNRLVVSRVEAVSILLKGFSYPILLGNMIPRFGRPVPELTMIASEMTSFVYDMYHDEKLNSFQQQRLAPAELEKFTQAIHNVGAPLTNCWGFVDGTARQICCSGEMQCTVHNGHKRIHAIKIQAIATPNRLIAKLYGLVEGRRHGSGMLADSAILPLLQQHSINENGNQLCIYGDLVYPLRPQLQTPFSNPQLNPRQATYNSTMSKARGGVE